MAKTTTIASIVVMVEYTSSHYGDEWNIGEMREQVKHEAINGLRSLIHGKGRIIGEPRVRTITTEECRDAD